MEYSVVIPAAGQGKRMRAGHNKQFIELGGKPILAHTLAVFEQDDWCTNVVIVANEQEIEEMGELANRYQISKAKKIVAGGRERQESVFAGLKALSQDGLVLIHDGARPFVTEKEIHSLVETAAKTHAAVLAVPVKDTIKRVEGEAVLETMPREELWAVQTPQAFDLALIKQAHQKAENEQMLGTDDASLMEWLGYSVAVVQGSYFNFKLTTPEDLLFAEAILAEKERR
ncbi:2-C-methyl-D-erythritol 4-phosphate cytidylyltransferase [Halalkalibacterium halodurans]|jgi:2-C-methyl-D-erythritol 4-phosphate cytidylyltransferase|uniref:2-C-methyl-D-erythritol 4-phosphate cytidylyltransferase n=2 Tax=Halalkalibacterium halodurans TaxID=86665 RepID=ISPD_HALH5|nr:2-C-methyl-D-erythritol 4-phosphate cytidylyltransferase [Halalkalibacterium halodurans]Q9KGF8.1 RecName: Full=2-C-methyl-D-erythritol 4-phosphate cytidylyltransferase; AltName: Full=4-diphosphocytidyl-2C-methyl-D-erythritol synthase; AltName: Full=MEP cytidylyltransferase; Short=MCT [Halalkalibacterium halodurans C-125]MDY7220609.1 2-C-methyl-D-erythritol 4-phosphate cytidylyltransferase [Halalkalibacterium halodurans]MDY7239848.1 2-C-methyl-D-erythritol 4-phosphate cytidylyltransferase [Hal